MNVENNNSFLQFDFQVNEQSSPIQFTNPLETICTYRLKEVNSCLQKINEAIIDGKYVAGYLSYEVAYAFHSVKNKKLDDSMPLLWFGVYDAPTKFSKRNTSSFHVGKWETDHSKDSYQNSFQNIMRNLKQGTMEQINYTIPFDTSFSGDSFAYYEQLKHAQQACYNAFLEIGHQRILSISPELFFHVQNNKITVKPMKGTIHRGKTYDEDLELKQWLQSSTKNRLENDLSVQLMKSELHPITISETISVTNQYDIEQYPTLYQMTSTITGEVLQDLKITDVIKHLFPSVSITGTPKGEAIHKIAKVEDRPRNVYCGTIGYITPNREAIFNVPIRTVLIDQMQKKATYHAGGAITLNSKTEEEYEEIITKTKILHQTFEPFQLLESLGLYNGKLSILDLHLKRIQQSAVYFNFKLNLEGINLDLLNLAKNHPEGQWKVRLLTNREGQYSVEIAPLGKIHSNQFTIAKTPVDQENQFLYHKTTARNIYKIHQVDHPDIFDTLLWNKNGEITEFTIGNVVAEIDGELITPPIECGLLPGTFREKLLKEGKIKEGIINKEDVKKCEKIWLINSVRHWVKMTYKH